MMLLSYFLLNPFMISLFYFQNERLKVYEEENTKQQDCYYLFEMGTSAVCPEQPLVTVSLSVGTILLIV